MADNSRLVMQRTHVPQYVADALAAEAALAGRTVSEHLRLVLTAHVGPVGQKSSSTAAALAQWTTQASGGTPAPVWRITVDRALRARGVSLPKLVEGNVSALVEWSRAVHPHLVHMADKPFLESASPVDGGEWYPEGTEPEDDPCDETEDCRMVKGVWTHGPECQSYIEEDQ